MSDQASPRVNSARLPDYSGRIVRLTGQVVRVSSFKGIMEFSHNSMLITSQSDASHEAIIKASDDGEVRILLSGVSIQRLH
jgi:replication factor A3